MIGIHSFRVVFFTFFGLWRYHKFPPIQTCISSRIFIENKSISKIYDKNFTIFLVYVRLLNNNVFIIHVTVTDVQFLYFWNKVFDFLYKSYSAYFVFVVNILIILKNKINFFALKVLGWKAYNFIVGNNLETTELRPDRI